ncbi:MAG TPA: recombination mediator RecR [Candidatus Paceibacterota bacterium]|jgi:recombination protein RecR|nr:MAG: Recombination protein RecR [Parcubacteria group bacterium ADurb.Bin115]HNU81243.1 recombination mediator RecR [bacterium]HPW34527.1 recombination mediator RecR [Candidatus Paceibacterota bacterium]HOD86939.1 recombination mediator RecR [bacterium]HPY99439.1 recombination mediator RecR [bacterium]
MKYPEYIQKLIESFSKFPSVGPKTAERYVFYLLNQKTVQVKELASFISSLPDNIKRCSICRTFSDSDPCPICGDKKRSPEILCIVENSQDLAVIENTKQFNGRYFVIDRLLNTLENIGPDQLPLKELKELINANKVKELILGLNFTLEGESTSLFLKKTFPEIKISRLARGLPAGSDLEYADELTLANALKYRNTL